MIPLAKAQDILKTYRENNYNASKALVKVGYGKASATKQSKLILNSAIKTIAKNKLENLVSSSNPMSLIEDIGLTSDEVIGEYLKIIVQDKDLSTKLKALLPLLAVKGLKWDNEQAKVNIPILNITTETILGEQLGPMDTIDVAQSTLSDIDRG